MIVVTVIALSAAAIFGFSRQVRSYRTAGGPTNEKRRSL